LAFAFATGLGASADLAGLLTNRPMNQSKMPLIALTSPMTCSAVFLAPSNSIRPSCRRAHPCLIKPTAVWAAKRRVKGSTLGYSKNSNHPVKMYLSCVGDGMPLWVYVQSAGQISDLPFIG